MYYHIMEMVNSDSLSDRVVGCAAQEGHGNPRNFMERNMMKIVSSAGWMAAWEIAKNKDDPKFNPDTGARSDVITDTMILAVVQPLVIAEAPQV